MSDNLSEMAYAITGGTNSSYMLTYQSTRPLTLLYFDGESAALWGLGQLDTQMLHLYGNVSGPAGDGMPNWGDFLEPEYRRAIGLCAWLEERGLRGNGVAGGGVEGVMRMNAGFEVIWCDFASQSLRLVANRNVTSPRLKRREVDEDVESTRVFPMGRGDAKPFPLPSATAVPTSTDEPQPTGNSPQHQWQGLDREPFASSMFWGWFESATWHYGSSRAAPALGEARASIRSCGILSYYSPVFANQSGNRAVEERQRLNLTDEGAWRGTADVEKGLWMLAKRRRLHELEAVTAVEAARMKDWSEEMLRGVVSGQERCSGMDWTLVISEIVQRTTGHLKDMEMTLSSPPGDDKSVWRWVFGLRDLSHMFLVPFLEYPSVEDLDHWQPGSALYDQTYSRCRFHYTRLLVDLDLSPEERDLRWAVEETFGTICAVLLTVGFGIEHMWFSAFDLDPRIDEPPPAPPGFNETIGRWRDGTTELLAWLGWEGEFTSCDKVCGWDERCYIPMWPLMGFGGPRGNGSYGGRHGRRPYYYYPPGYGDDPYGGGGGPRYPPPGFNWTMPRRAPWMMGDDTALFSPVCVKRESMARGVWS